MEKARNDKAIGSSLDAKVLLFVADGELKKQLNSLNLTDSLSGNGVDELRYLFLASQIELVKAVDEVRQANYWNELDWLAVGIVNADGEKCDRCWNYSTRVGEFSSDPTICERCNAALAGEF